MSSAFLISHWVYQVPCLSLKLGLGGDEPPIWHAHQPGNLLPSFGFKKTVVETTWWLFGHLYGASLLLVFGNSLLATKVFDNDPWARPLWTKFPCTIGSGETWMEMIRIDTINGCMLRLLRTISRLAMRTRPAIHDTLAAMALTHGTISGTKESKK